MIAASILGRAGADPQSRQTNNGTEVVSFSLATDHGWGDRRSTTWVQVSVFGSRAKVVRERLRTGRRVVVHGELFEETWTDRDGQTRKALKLNADHVEIVDWDDQGSNTSSKGNARATSTRKPAAQPDDDLPF